MANAEANIEAADALAAGDLVELPKGEYPITTSCTLDNGSLFVGHGSATKLNLASNTESITLSGAPERGVANRLWDLEVVAPENYTGEAVVYAYDTICRADDIWKNLTVVCAGKPVADIDQTGKGVVLRATDDIGPIELSNARGLHVYGFEYGLYFECTESSSGAYLNGNQFSDMSFIKCANFIYAITAGTPSPLIQGNTFSQIQLQYFTAVTSGIYLNSAAGGVSRNIFEQIYFWDWPASNQIYCTATALHNKFSGFFNLALITDLSHSCDFASTYDQNGGKSIQLQRFVYQDLSGSGMYMWGVAGEETTRGQMSRLDKSASGKFWGTDADTYADTEGLLGICMDATIAADAWGRWHVYGNFRNDAKSWDDAPIYVSPTKFDMCQFGDLAGGDFARVVGYPSQADYVFFNPSNLIITLNGSKEATHIDNIPIALPA